MGPKQGRKNARKIEIPRDTPTDFKLGDTAADIQRMREEREQREREEVEKQQREERKETRGLDKTPQSLIDKAAAKETKN